MTTKSWQRPLGTRVALHTGGPDLRLRIADAETDLIFDGGALITIQTASSTEPDLVFHGEPEYAIASLTGETIDLLMIEVAAPGEPVAPPYPFDFEPPSTVLPTAEAMRVQLYTADTPFGLVTYWDTITAGQLVARHPGRASQPDAVIKQSFREVIESLDPALRLLEAISGARVSARHPGVYMTLAGAYDAPGVRANLNRRPRTNAALLALSAHTRHPGWRSR